MNKKLTILLIFLLGLAHVFAQERTITGKVLDETGSPLLGATVSIKGTTKGTVTDLDGKYSIQVPSSGGTLIVSYVGYLSKEVEIGASDIIDLTMVADVKSLEEIVVVGYGVQKKSLTTGSISKIDSKEITAAPATRIDQAIQGKTAGVFMAQSSGSPGSSMSIKIRGNSSNGKNDPIYVVDGTKVSSIDFLSPSDIESIEILKDAASSAIYGSEGGNGVIIVTTKTASKSNTGEVNYNYYHSWQSYSHSIKMMDATEYYNFLKDAAKIENQLFDSTAFGTANTNWMKEISNAAPTDEHELSFSKADENGSMFLSLSYLNQNGVIGGSKNNYTRYTFRFAGDSKIKEYLQVGANISYSKSKKQNLYESNEYGGILSNAIYFDPTVPVYYKDTSEVPASYKETPEIFNYLTQNSNGQYYHLSPLTSTEGGQNPLAQLHNSYNTTSIDKILGDIHGEIKIMDFLKFRTSLALEYALQYDWIFCPNYWASSLLNYTNDTTNSVQNTWNKGYKYTFDNVATFNKSFGSHTLEVMAGTSYQNSKPMFLDVVSYFIPHNEPSLAYLYNTQNLIPAHIPYVNGGYGVVNNANTQNRPTTNFGKVTYPDNVEVQYSYFFRASYNFKEKYMIQGSFRRDASSMFDTKNHFGNFPAFSLGWNISKESFFKDNIPFIDNAKLRFSWGRNGNKQILPNAYLYTSTLITNTYYPNLNRTIIPGAVPDHPGNPDLKWETNQAYDLGVELSFLKNKLQLIVDYYDRKTKDQLAPSASTPYYLGFTNLPYVNNGEVENKGYEFEITYKEMKGDFKYSVSFNASYLENKVLTYKAPLNGTSVGTSGAAITRYEAGYPVWYFQGYRALGLFQDTTQIKEYYNITDYNYSHNIAHKIYNVPGDVIYQDVDSDRNIGIPDLQNIGKPWPDWTFGFNLSLAYKGFDMNCFFQGVTGNQIFFAAIRTDYPFFNKPEFYYTEAWTKPGSSNKIPRPSVNSAYNYLWSTNNIYSGDYLRLKNLTLGYTLPKDITKKVGISKFRVYVTAVNLVTLTNYPGSDPEIGQGNALDPSSYGIDKGLYPSSKSWTVGLNLTF
jgi:TonB-dependent starch-binding outer membrane protein SusC